MLWVRAMFFGTLSTPRLLLRPIAPEDAEPIFAGYARDPEVTRFLTWRPHADIGQTRAYVDSCLASATGRTFVLIERSGGRLVGAFDVRQRTGWRVEFGYVLARAVWGRGLMTEALSGVVAWCLAQPAIWRVDGVCDVENVASARVMRKAGLTEEGVLRRWIMHPNVSTEPRDCRVFARVR